MINSIALTPSICTGTPEIKASLYFGKHLYLYKVTYRYWKPDDSDEASLYNLDEWYKKKYQQSLYRI